MGIEQQARSVQTVVPNNMTVSRFCYRIGVHSILLEAGLVAEVLTSQTVYPLPFSPDWCAGLVSLRGDLFPVVDMHKVLLGNSASVQPQLLLIQHPQFSPVILTCDGFPAHIKLSQEDLTTYAGENLPNWIPYTLRHNGQTLLAADHGRLLRHIRRLSDR